MWLYVELLFSKSNGFLIFVSISGLLVASGWVQAQAQPAAVFDEVVVTAEKRYESLQGLSQSVTAYTSQDISNKNIQSFVDLSVIAPGVIVAKNEGFKTVVAIRGVGNEANQNASANPSVSYHFDGVYIASPYALQAIFFDLERIEILRGPQATVFGQNATGGAINLVTKEPSTIGLSGSADVTVGEYDNIGLRGVVNIPINQSMALRASVATHKHDGYSDNVVLDQDLDDADSMSARLRFLWRSSDQLSWYLTAQYFDEDRNGAAQKGLLDPTRNNRKLAQDSLSSYELTTELYSLRAEWDLDDFAINYVASYQSDDIVIQRDNDRNDIDTLPPFALLPSYFDPEQNRQKTTTQEIYLVSNEMLFDRIDWMAGIFYLDTEVEVSIRERLDFNFDGLFAPIDEAEVLAFGGEVGFISDAKTQRKSTSIYARGTYNVNDDFRVISGLRHTKDKVNSKVNNFFGRAGLSNLKASTEEVTGRIAMEYDLNGTTMVYGFYTKSFKPGGSNLTFGLEDIVGPIIVLPTYEDESIDAFELGIKIDLFGSRMRMNSSIFYYQYENLQFQSTDPEVFQGGVGNVPEAEIYGAEIEFLSYLSDQLTVDLKVSYLETEITDDFLAVDNIKSEAATNALICCGTALFSDQVQQVRAAQIENLEGNELAKAPKFSVDLSLRHQTNLWGWGGLTSTLQYIYRNDMQQRIFNNKNADTVPQYHLVNLVFNFDPTGAAWGLDVMAMNLGDEDGVNARFTDVFGVAATADELIAPRQFMVRARLAF